MSKEAKLMGVLGNIKESMGVFERGPEAAPAGPRAMDPRHVGAKRSTDGYAIEVQRIIPDPDQPRKEFDADALARLAESLKTRGQLQPIMVRWDEGVGMYVILTGERRWRAAQAAGVPTLRCVVRDSPIGDDERLSLQLIENALREDLSPMEQSRAFKTLMDRQGWNQERLAEELAVSPMLVSRAMGLLRLPAAVQEQVEQGGLAPSAAYEIAKLDDPTEQIRLATNAAEQGLTRDDVVKQVRSAGQGRKKSGAKKVAAKKLPPAMVWRLNGYRVEVSRKSGVEAREAIAALEEAAARIRQSLEGEAEAA